MPKVDESAMDSAPDEIYGHAKDSTRADQNICKDPCDADSKPSKVCACFYSRDACAYQRNQSLGNGDTKVESKKEQSHALMLR